MRATMLKIAAQTPARMVPTKITNSAMLSAIERTAGNVTSTPKKLFKSALKPATFMIKKTIVIATTSPIPIATVKTKANLTTDQKLTLTSLRLTGLTPVDSLRLTVLEKMLIDYSPAGSGTTAIAEVSGHPVVNHVLQQG
jgi:hypothetical protein